MKTNVLRWVGVVVLIGAVLVNLFVPGTLDLRTALTLPKRFIDEVS